MHQLHVGDRIVRHDEQGDITLLAIVTDISAEKISFSRVFVESTTSYRINTSESSCSPQVIADIHTCDEVEFETHKLTLIARELARRMMGDVTSLRLDKTQESQVISTLLAELMMRAVLA